MDGRKGRGLLCQRLLLVYTTYLFNSMARVCEYLSVKISCCAGISVDCLHAQTPAASYFSTVNFVVTVNNFCILIFSCKLTSRGILLQIHSNDEVATFILYET